MQNKKHPLLQYLYAEHLKVINNIKLTRREVDVLSFFVSGRSAKKIAHFFSISPKTIEHHTHNIMLKMGCHSKEGIIDFVERSNKLPYLRKFYVLIHAQNLFDQALEHVAQDVKRVSIPCSLYIPPSPSSEKLIVSSLESSLKIAGIQILTTAPSSSKNSDHYVLLMNFKKPAKKKQDASPPPSSHILLLHPGIPSPIEILRDPYEINSLDLINQKVYYTLVFEILKKLLPTLDLKKIESTFQKHYKEIENLIEHKDTLTGPPPSQEEAPLFSHKKFFSLLKRKWYGFGALFALCLIIISVAQILIPSFKIAYSWLPIRSELITPTENSFLKRPSLISQIENRFKGSEDIQTLALVGLGGVGKTTLAREYANLQTSPVIWIINAESRETLNLSFKHLADALATQSGTLHVSKKIEKEKNPKEAEHKMIQFVKENLKKLSNWLLIYDNVKTFTDIQTHFPKDPKGWGRGKILLTTQDSTIENNPHVKSVIYVGEMTPEQKICLFTKIMNNGGAEPFKPEQEREARLFLQDIPSFPLDVSVAARYINSTNISYKDYLKYINNYEFSKAQENILKGDVDYNKTRYGIITLSLKALLKEDPNFQDLLLFICFLDSQNIPRDLLTQSKNSVIIDNFIRHLKKYSLITNETSSKARISPTFSIHRSTHAIILAYLIKDLNLLHNKHLLQDQIKVLSTCMKSALDKEDFTKMKNLSLHAEQILKHPDLLNETSQGIIRGELGCIYYYFCDYPRAKALIEKSLANLQNSQNPDYKKIAHFQIYLGNINRKLGNYKRAINLFEHSIQLYKRLPKNELEKAKAYGYLGVSYRELGSFKKAKPLLEKTVAIYTSTPSKATVKRAWSLSHLGSIYKRIGDYEKARQLFEESLKIYKQQSEEYVGTGWVYGDLGDVYVSLGQYKKAKSHLDKSLSICRGHFYEDHIHIAQASLYLARYHMTQKNYKEARRLLEKSLIIFEKTFGKNSLNTRCVLLTLGELSLLEGNLQAAEHELSHALKILKSKKHPEQYLAYEQLAELSLKKGLKAQEIRENKKSAQEKEKALAYLYQAFELCKTHLPEDSPNYLRVKQKLEALNRSINS